VWEEQPFEPSVQYDLIVTLGESAVVLSYCPEDAVPWPMRGAQRWSDSYLLSVNGKPVQANEVFAAMDVLWTDRRAVRRILDWCLVSEELGRQAFEVEPRDLQEAMDALRHRRGLLSAEQTRAWLEQYGLSHEALEAEAERVVRYRQLRDSITGAQIECYFEAHRSERLSGNIAWQKSRFGR
jgi:putative peptide maturation system protein